MRMPRFTLAEPVPALDALLEQPHPPTFPISGYKPACDVLPDDYIHDPLHPGRCLRISTVDDGTFVLAVWTRGPWPNGPWHEARFGRRPTDRVLVTRLVDDNLEKS